MDPDQTARMCRLVWLHAGHKRTLLVFHGAAHTCLLLLKLLEIQVHGSEQQVSVSV
jgi:hypothetical protein